MPFHATAAAASARPNRISTLRNHLLCSVCAAMLLAGSSTMAWAEDPAPQPVPKVSKTVEAGTRLAIREGDRVDEVVVNKDGKLDIYPKGTATTVTVNEGGDAQIYSQIGTATVAGKDSLLRVYNSEGTVGTVTINKDGKLEVWVNGTATTVNVNGGGYAGAMGGNIGTATITGEDSKLVVTFGSTAGTVNVNKDGKLEVWFGGKADTVTVNEGGNAETYSQIGTATIIGKDGKLDVKKGGTAGTVNVNKDGTLGVHSDGTVDTVNVNDGGYAKTVGKIGTATIIGKDSKLEVALGGTADTVNVKDGGYALANDHIETATVGKDSRLRIADNGTANNVTVDTGGKLTLIMASSVKDVTVNGEKAWNVPNDPLGDATGGLGGIAHVYGGEITKGTVNKGGLLEIENVQEADNSIIVNAGGLLRVTSNDEIVGGVSKATVNDSGIADIYGWIDDVAVNKGGVLRVFAKGLATRSLAVSGGHATTAGNIKAATISKDGETVGVLDVLDKGTAGAVHINTGGALGVEAGGVAEDVTLDGGNAVTKGKIVKATVNHGGKLEANNGGFVKDLAIEGVEAWRFSHTKNEAGDYPILSGVGGTAFISDEGSHLESGTVGLGGALAVEDKAAADTVTVRNGGKLDVMTGGTADDVTVHGEKVELDKDGKEIHVAAFATVSGTESRITKATVNVDGVLRVKDKAAAGTVTINKGGLLDVYNGGTAGTVNVDGTLIVEDEASAGAVTVNNGGFLDVLKRGEVKDLAIEGVKAWSFRDTKNEAGEFPVVGGVGGFAFISDEGSHLESGTVGLGGDLTVKDKAAADTVTVRNGGRLDVYNGALVKDLTVEGGKAWDASGDGGIGGIAFISGEGSHLESGTVDLGGMLEVKGKAVAGTVTVRNGGWLDVLNGGLVKDVTVEGDKAWDVTTGLGGVGGVAFISGERSHLESGTVNLGGKLVVANQATADTATVRNGGRLDVYNGALVKDLTAEGVKAWDAITGLGGVGGVAFIYGEGSRLDHGTVDLGGKLVVKDKAAADTVTVRNGGRLDVHNGAFVKDLTVEGVKAWDATTSLGGIGGFAFIDGEGSRLDHGTVDLGGGLAVVNKATAGTVTVNKGGSLAVTTGGKADDVTVKDYGTAYTSGEIVRAVVDSNSMLTVQAGGKAGDVTLRGNTGNVGLVVSAGGKVTDITSAGGKAAISGEVTGRSTFYGGQVFVNAGGKMADVSMNGGTAVVFDQGQITGKSTVDNGGYFGVAAGGKAGDIILNGGPSAVNDSYMGVLGTVGDITINQNGHLSGTGTVGNVKVHAGGYISPGTGEGDGMLSPLKATGNVTFDKGSFFGVRIANDGTKAGKLDVQGKAELLGGVVWVRAQDIDKETGKLAILSKEQLGKLFQKSFVVLEARDGVVGKFEKVEQQANYNYITPSLAYDNTTVKLGFELTELAKNNEAAEKLAAEKQKQDEAEKQAAQKTIQVLDGQLKKNEAEVDRVKGEMQKLEEQVKAQKDADEKQKVADRAKVATEAKAAEEKIQKLNAELKQKQDEADSVKAEKQAAQKTIQVLDGQLKKNEAEVDRVKGEMQKLEEQVKTQKDADDKQRVADREKVATELKQKQDEADRQKTEKQAAQKTIQDLDGQLKQKGAEIDQVKADKQKLEDQVKAQKDADEKQKVADRAKVATDAKAAEEKIQKLNAELKQKQDEADSVTAEKLKLEEQAKLVAEAKAAEEKAKQEAAALAEAERLKIVALEERVKNLVLVDAVTPNQKSTGHAVMQLGLGNRLLQTVLFSQKGEVLHYDTLSGEAHATLRGTLLQDAGLVSGAASERVRAAFDGVGAKPAPVATPLAYGPDDKDKRSAGEAFAAATPAPAAATTALWGQAYGGWSHGASDGNAAAYSRSTGGIVTGMDALIAGTWRLGVLAGYGSTSLHGAGSSVSADSYQLGIYGGT
ncbi:hypothetical protein ACNPO7_06765, partial [Phyllobacterium calauticae]